MQKAKSTLDEVNESLEKAKEQFQNAREKAITESQLRKDLVESYVNISKDFKGMAKQANGHMSRIAEHLDGRVENLTEEERIVSDENKERKNQIQSSIAELTKEKVSVQGDAQNLKGVISELDKDIMYMSVHLSDMEKELEDMRLKSEDV